MIQIILLTLLTDFSLCSSINVVIDPLNIESAAGSSVTLTCTVEGYEEPITWVYPKDADPSNLVINDRVLTILALSLKDVGQYKCKFVFLDNDSVLLRGDGYSVVQIKAVKPGQPQNLRVTTFEDQTISLTWRPGVEGFADTLYYSLEYMTEDSSWLELQDIASEVTAFKVTDLTLESSYQFRISQINKIGESVPSDPTSSVYLPKRGAVTVHPTLERLEQYNSTSIRVFWSMPEFSDVVTEWYIEYRIYHDDRPYKTKSVAVDRTNLIPKTVYHSILQGLEEYRPYQIRMFCKNMNGRGPSSPIQTITTSQAAPSGPPRNIRVDYLGVQELLEITWLPPPARDQNGDITGYTIKIYLEDPATHDTLNSTIEDAGEQTSAILKLSNASLPVWVGVAAATSEGIGPFSDFVQAKLEAHLEEPSVGALDEFMKLLKQPWLIAIIGVILIVFFVMISIIVCRQQKIKQRKLEQLQHPPLFNSYHSSINSSINGGQYRPRGDEGPQYEKIPDSRTNTPQGSRSVDGRMFDQRSTPNSFIDHRMNPPNYRDLSIDSQRYSSQNSSIDDLASTIPSVTYSLPLNKEGYKVVNPTSNERPQNIPVHAVPPKAKEHDPNAIKPKVYGNITVKEWREQQRKRNKADLNSDTSLLSSFGKDSGRGSTDNVSISDSDGSDIEKYLEEDYSPRNSGYIEDDLMDVARMGMSRSPPDNSAFLHPQQRHPPVSSENYRGEDATSIESDPYIQCEYLPHPVPPHNVYNLNGGISEIED